MRAVIAPASSPVRLFAPRARPLGCSRHPVRVAASFSFEGSATSETNEATAKHGGGHAGTSSPMVRLTERGIHGAGDEPHSPIPLITGLEYKAAPDGAVHLPPPDIRGHDSLSFERVVAERRCCRDFAELPTGLLHLWEIAQLSWAAQGITAPETSPDQFGHAGAARRAAPSGGRLYPLTLYVIASETVGGIVPGPYKYLPECHALLPMGVAQCPPQQGEVDDECECEDDGGDSDVLGKLLRSTVPQVARLQHQSWMDTAGVIFLISGNASVTKSHGGLYQRFGDDLVKFEAGCVAENLALQANSLGLGATFVGAFEADQVKAAIASRDEGEVPLLMMAVGVPKGSHREHHGGDGVVPFEDT